MPKQTTKNKKVVSSNTKKSISTPMGVLIVLVVGLLLAIIGTYGFTKYRANSLKAKAGNFTNIVEANYASIRIAACKKRVLNKSGQFDVNVIASKDAETKLTKRVWNLDATESTNPIYAVMISDKIAVSAVEKQNGYGYYWERGTDIKSKVNTPWWGNEVNARTYKNVRGDAKIAAQGGSDTGGMTLWDEDEYIINTSDILAPVFDDYTSVSGGTKNQAREWKKLRTAWENRILAVNQLVDCQ